MDETERLMLSTKYIEKCAECEEQKQEISKLKGALRSNNANKKSTPRFTKVMLNGYKPLVFGGLTLRQRGILQALPYLVRGYSSSGKLSYVSGEILDNPVTGASISSWSELGKCLNISKSAIPRAKKELSFLEKQEIIIPIKNGNKTNFYLKDTQYFCSRRV